MDLTREEENFCKSTKMIIEIMPKHLRQLFVAEWDVKFPSQPWANDNVSGQLLVNTIPPSAKNRNGDLNRKELQPKILSGDTNSWDPTILFYLFFYADLQLIDTCRPYTQRAASINRFRELRNCYFGHPANMSMSVNDFETLSKEIKDIAKYVFGAVAENEIDQIVHSQIQSLEYHALKKKYDEEKRDYDVVMSRLDALEQKIEQRGKILEPITQEAIGQRQKANIDKMKETYKELYKKHEIHCVDEKDRIVLRERDVSDFAVKLTIHLDSYTNSTFRDEVRRYLDNLAEVTGDEIEISNVIDENHRVTFIRGIAGMGKSVLAKQLTYGWASEELYQEFKLCVMFECRDLNYFRDHEGAKLEKHEILGKFLRHKVSYDLGDGDGVLVIVDGLDELYDITEEDCIIGQLLCRKIYARSKVIVTGRPHIECKLNGYRNMGGMRTFEIQGLSSEQIDIYARKFSSGEDHIVNIMRAKGASLVPILHVPQFLNTFCCIAGLLKGQAISNSTELYCWTVFLLLKQHAYKTSSNGRRVSETFMDFSNTLGALSKVCYNLLTENKIVFEGNFKLLFGDIGMNKEFIQSLFVDVSDNFTEKYQFKDISLMEFLSSLHICKTYTRYPIEVIKENLEQGFIAVVLFVCRLLAGFSSEGIIKEMLKYVVGIEKEVNEKQLLRDVLEVLNKSEMNKKTKLNKTFEVITYFLNRNFTDKTFIKSIIGRCSSEYFLSDVNVSEYIGKICKHLVNCEWQEAEIQEAFGNVLFEEFNISTLEPLEFASSNYFRIGDYGGIFLRNLKVTVNAIRMKFAVGNNCGYRGRVVISCCKFHDEVSDCMTSDRELAWLEIQECKFETLSSFTNLCIWGMSCVRVYLSHLEIERQWWEILVNKIQQRYENEALDIRELDIDDCTTDIKPEIAMRIVQCGVRLWINNKEFVISKSLIPVRIPGLMPEPRPIMPGKSSIPVRVTR